MGTAMAPAVVNPPLFTGTVTAGSSVMATTKTMTATPTATIATASRGVDLRPAGRDPDHTKHLQHGASKAPRGPHPGPRNGERAAPRVACMEWDPEEPLLPGGGGSGQ
jgi:hypothetical protein